MMIPWHVSTFSEFIFWCFPLSRLFSSENKSVNASKITNYVRKGWKLMRWICILHLNSGKVRSCTKLLKYWVLGVTDEFLSETLILPKRLSSSNRLLCKHVKICIKYIDQYRLSAKTHYCYIEIHQKYIDHQWSFCVQSVLSIWVLSGRNRRRLILRPQILHIEFNEDQVVVIVWEVTYLRW